MKKTTLLLALLATGLVSAQPKPSNEEIDARFAAMSAQRNQAMDHVVVLQARLAMLESELQNKKSCDKKE